MLNVVLPIQDAENAIISMNGQWIGSKAIRTNWASQKPPAPRETKKSMSTNVFYRRPWYWWSFYLVLEKKILVVDLEDPIKKWPLMAEDAFYK